MDRCSKCLTEGESFVKYTDLTNTYALCPFCQRMFDVNMLVEFMKEDFGGFPISEISKSIINSRKARALGKGAWNSVEGK